MGGVYTTTGLTTGSYYYVSDTAGTLSAAGVQGTYPVAVGQAISATKLRFTNNVSMTPTVITLATTEGFITPFDSILSGTFVTGASTLDSSIVQSSNFDLSSPTTLVRAVDGDAGARCPFSIFVKKGVFIAYPAAGDDTLTEVKFTPYR